MLANHPHQLLVGAVVYSSAFQFGEIVERGRTLARDVYTDHSLVSVDDAQHRLQLQESHIAVAPVGNGILLSEHILVDGDIHRLVNQTASLGRPRTMVVEHYQRERLAETRHPILREIMEVARIDEVQCLGRVRCQSAAQLRPRLLVAIAVNAADVVACVMSGLEANTS